MSRREGEGIALPDSALLSFLLLLLPLGLSLPGPVDVDHIRQRGGEDHGLVVDAAGLADDALDRHDLSEGPVWEGEFTQESGYEARRVMDDFDRYERAISRPDEPSLQWGQ